MRATMSSTGDSYSESELGLDVCNLLDRDLHVPTSIFTLRECDRLMLIKLNNAQRWMKT
jgi:hypothetical protein